MKRIILCADDYGQNLAISQAIIELLDDKHLSATSCLVTQPNWASQAKMLAPYTDQIDIGLHFNLTDGKPLSKELPAFLPLKDLIIKSFTKGIKKEPIVSELNAQLEAFVEATGKLPDFIDGHKHVHQFPIVRDAFLQVFDERLRESGAYVRCTFDPASLYRVKDVAFLKQLIIQLTGGIIFKRELEKRKITHNSTFAGIYNFAAAPDYSRLFPRFLSQVGDRGLIMCHPGMHSTEETEEIVNMRHQEYIYFSSPKFLHICREQEIKLIRFKDV
jgi:predicted glycoside hydrolase/deacetylase ChbG (UPF0249 family)